MLDKIRNLSLNLGDSNTGNYYSVYGKGIPREQKDRDNYEQSEALKYLNELGWNIKTINFLNELKIDISFVISQLEFQTVLDFSETFIEKIKYSVSAANNLQSEKIIALISINTNSDVGFHSNDYKEPEAIKTLLSRIFELNPGGEITSEDYTFLNELLDGIYIEIYTELFFITQCLLRFIYKLIGRKPIAPQYSSEPSVKLIGIKPLPLQ